MHLRPRGAGGPDASYGHLTYCTNIHPAEAWSDVADGLRRHLPDIKRQVCPDAPLGVGLRLAAAAAEALTDPAALDELKAILADGPYYVFTINGFPYGAFHGARVKDGAYAPDWADPRRLSYTNQLADHLAALLPADLTGSISTVPGTFKPWAAGPDGTERVASIADHMIQHAAYLHGLRERTGKTIVLAPEPEPACLFETIAETIAFFEHRLFAAPARARFAGLTGLADAEAETALRRHLAVCYDVCHAAVEFEDPAGSVAALKAAGIPVAKLQLSAALRLATVDPAGVKHLRAFDEPVYLHQTIERRGGALTRYLDLPEAFAAAENAAGAEWRSHFHVPVFLDRLQHFDTTQAFLREILALHWHDPISDHLEVETYTWDVLPEAYRGVPVADAIARELRWVMDQRPA